MAEEKIIDATAQYKHPENFGLDHEFYNWAIIQQPFGADSTVRYDPERVDNSNYLDSFISKLESHGYTKAQAQVYIKACCTFGRNIVKYDKNVKIGEVSTWISTIFPFTRDIEMQDGLHLLSTVSQILLNQNDGRNPGAEDENANTKAAIDVLFLNCADPLRNAEENKKQFDIDNIAIACVGLQFLHEIETTNRINLDGGSQGVNYHKIFPIWKKTLSNAERFQQIVYLNFGGIAMRIQEELRLARQESIFYQDVTAYMRLTQEDYREAHRLLKHPKHIINMHLEQAISREVGIALQKGHSRITIIGNRIKGVSTYLEKSYKYGSRYSRQNHQYTEYYRISSERKDSKQSDGSLQTLYYQMSLIFAELARSNDPLSHKDISELLSRSNMEIHPMISFMMEKQRELSAEQISVDMKLLEKTASFIPYKDFVGIRLTSSETPLNEIMDTFQQIGWFPIAISRPTKTTVYTSSHILFLVTEPISIQIDGEPFNLNYFLIEVQFAEPDSLQWWTGIYRKFGNNTMPPLTVKDGGQKSLVTDLPQTSSPYLHLLILNYLNKAKCLKEENYVQRVRRLLLYGDHSELLRKLSWHNGSFSIIEIPELDAEARVLSHQDLSSVLSLSGKTPASARNVVSRVVSEQVYYALIDYLENIDLSPAGNVKNDVAEQFRNLTALNSMETNESLTKTQSIKGHVQTSRNQESLSGAKLFYLLASEFKSSGIMGLYSANCLTMLNNTLRKRIETMLKNEKITEDLTSELTTWKEESANAENQLLISNALKSFLKIYFSHPEFDPKMAAQYIFT